MTGRLLHVSDLHFGGHDEGREPVEAAVQALVAELDPELVVASGDLTHRNRPEQHERAASFLRSFVADEIDWAHLDIAPASFNEGSPDGEVPVGGTGVAVRTLVELARGLQG